MKVSNYNLVYPVEGQGYSIVYNSLSGALAKVGEPLASRLGDRGATAGLDPRALQGAAACGFMIDDAVDERALLEERYHEAKVGTSRLDLTIAPTLDCNFGCFYCYQDRDPAVMSPQTADAIVEFVRARQGLRHLTVSWYGGEPLMCFDLVAELSRALMALAVERGFVYEASMVSNGYLLDPKQAETLASLALRNIQITIDGPPALHDKRRNLLGRAEGTFWPIIENLRILVARGVHVTVRINVDKTNVERVPDLLDILVDQGLDTVSVYLGQVKLYSSKVARAEKIFLDKAEMAQWDARLQDMLAARGFRPSRDLHFPQQKATYCAADRVGAYVINYNGDLFKCWAEIGDERFRQGTIAAPPPQRQPSEDERAVCAKWDAWSPFAKDKGCADCKMLPVCMGGCAFAGLQIHDTQPECIKWKFNLEETLRRHVEASR